MKYRKKPAIIEAIQWTGSNIREIRHAFPGARLVRRNTGVLSVTTLEGVMLAQTEDWIIKGTAGEFYPCKPDIFSEVYEAVEGND